MPEHRAWQHAPLGGATRATAATREWVASLAAARPHGHNVSRTPTTLAASDH